MLTVSDVEKLYEEAFGELPEFGFSDGGEDIEKMLEAIDRGEPIPSNEQQSRGENVSY